MFIHTDRGSISLDHVVCVRRTKDDRSLLISADGSHLGETHLSVEDIELMSCPVVPAEPGAFAYGVVIDRHEAPIVPLIIRKQIVAWRILPRDEPEPVFSDGACGEKIILPLPDGKFYRPYGSWHDSLDEAVQSIVSEVMEDRQ